MTFLIFPDSKQRQLHFIDSETLPKTIIRIYVRIHLTNISLGSGAMTLYYTFDHVILLDSRNKI